MKRILSFILAAALVIGLMPTIVFAAVGDTFNVNFYEINGATADDLTNYYAKADTTGSNWKINSAETGEGHYTISRLQVAKKDPAYSGFKFWTISNNRGNFSVNFTASKAGCYKVIANTTPYKAGGKTINVSVNGAELSPIDSYGSMEEWGDSFTKIRTQELGTVYLAAGEYVNSITILPTDGNLYLESFTFEEVEPVPTAVKFNFYNELAVKPSNTDPKDDRLSVSETTGANFVTIVEESNSFQTGDNRVYSAGGQAYPQFDLGKGADSTWITSGNNKERKWTFKIPITAAGWYDVKFLGAHWFANDPFYLYVGDKFAGIYDFSGGITRAESDSIFLGDNKRMNTLYLTPDADGYVKVMLAFAKNWGYGQARMAPIEMNLTPSTHKDVKCVDIVHTIPATMAFGETASFEAYALMSDGTRRSFNGYTSVATADANNGITVDAETSDMVVTRTSDPLFDEGNYEGTVSANGIGEKKIVLTAKVDGETYSEEATINIAAAEKPVAFKLGLMGDDLTHADNTEPKDWTVNGAEIVPDKTVVKVGSRRYTYAWGHISQMTTLSGFAAWPNLTPDSQQIKITFKKTVPAAGIYDVSFEGYTWNACAEYAIYVDGKFVGNTNCHDPAGTLDGTSKVSVLNRIELPEGPVEISFRARKSHYNGGMFFTPKELAFAPATGDIAISEVEASGIPETMEAGATADGTAKAKMTTGEYRHFGFMDNGALPVDNEVIKVTSSNPAVVAVTDVVCVKYLTEAENKDASLTLDPTTTTYKLNAIRAGTADITVTAIVDGKEKSTTKTITVSGEAMEETISKKTAAVSVVALTGGSVTTSLGNAIENVELGTSVSATATAGAGYKFAYWQNSNGNVISANATETFVINTNTSIKAYFEKVVTDADATVPVYFYNGNGEALKTENVEKGKTFAEIAKPSASLTGYVFENWSVSDDAVINDVTRAVALFAESDTRYIVTINDGNSTTTEGATYGTEISATAKGDDFSYWMLGDDIVSYDKTLRIKVYGNMTLTAAYAGAKAAAPTVALEERNGSYFLTYSVPAGYTKLEAGILFSKTGTPRVGASYSKAIERTGSGQFTAKPIGEGDNIARGYVMYSNGSETVVIYAK